LAREGRDRLKQPVAFLLGIFLGTQLYLHPFSYFGNDACYIGSARTQFLLEFVDFARKDVGTQCFDKRKVRQRQRALFIAVTEKRSATAQRDIGG
jgi:hypothetical protein